MIRNHILILLSILVPVLVLGLVLVSVIGNSNSVSLNES